MIPDDDYSRSSLAGFTATVHDHFSLDSSAETERGLVDRMAETERSLVDRIAETERRLATLLWRLFGGIVALAGLVVAALKLLP